MRTLKVSDPTVRVSDISTQRLAIIAHLNS